MSHPPAEPLQNLVEERPGLHMISYDFLPVISSNSEFGILGLSVYQHCCN